jgi:hypothetical protein
MANEPHSHTTDKLLAAYRTMLDRINHAIDDAEKEVVPTLEQNLETAREKATELGELSREEADKISEYLKRDLQEAAGFLEETGQDFRDWFKFDLGLVEDRFLEAFTNMADKTRLELAKLQQQANLMGEWHTGEVTGIGTLRCTGCGEELHFHKPGHIPPCPACRGTVFKRISQKD